MSGTQVMIVLIVAMALIASFLKSRQGGRRQSGSSGLPVTADAAETDRLRDEVRQLKERIQVLERITVDKENSLERQIEELRHRP